MPLGESRLAREGLTDGADEALHGGVLSKIKD